MKQPRLSIGLGFSAVAAIAACNSILGFDDLSVRNDLDGGGATGGSGGSGGTDGGQQTCSADCTNQKCTELASADAGGTADGGVVPAVCEKTMCRCVPLLSPDCTTVTGDYTNDDAIIIGSLFQTSTKSPQSATNLARERGAILALKQINEATQGIPANSTSAGPRPLVMVSCNAFVDTAGGGTADTQGLLPAAKHLVNDLHIPAMVGPNTSQDTLDVSNKVTIPGKTVVLTPTGVAASIAGLTDDKLTWQMVPNDAQRKPLMISEQPISAQNPVPVGQIKALEQQLKTDRSVTTVKLAVAYRDDALGAGTNSSLSELVLNGESLFNGQQKGTVKISPYKPPTANDPLLVALVDSYVTFAPDIIVLAGTAEVVTQIMVPLEAKWTATDRPYYILIDSGKVPDLRTAVTGKDDLRKRVRGTGITPGSAQGVFNQFASDYTVAYGSAAAGEALVSGVGSSYDAVYALAFALAATKDLPVSGPNVVKGLAQLAGGSPINVGRATALQAFGKLAAGEKLAAVGTFGPFAWDSEGAVLGGALEIWCIDTNVTFQSSGLTYDLLTKTASGAINTTKCGWQ